MLRANNIYMYIEKERDINHAYFTYIVTEIGKILDFISNKIFWKNTNKNLRRLSVRARARPSYQTLESVNVTI